MTTWVTATVLRLLAGQQLKRAAEFTARQLGEWCQGELTDAQRVHASTRLVGLGFLQHGVEVILGERMDVYTVTAPGAAAIQAAGEGAVRKSGPKGTRRPNPVDPGALVSRLWALMRIRKMLDSDSAAQLLCDAGDQAAFDRAQATIRRTLKRWASTGAVAEGARRLGAQGTSNGVKRYVLVVDSAEPPRWRPSEKARKAAGSRAG